MGLLNALFLLVLGSGVAVGFLLRRDSSAELRRLKREWRRERRAVTRSTR